MNSSVNFGKDQQPGLKTINFEDTDGVFFKEMKNPAGKAPVNLGIVIDLLYSTNLGMIPSDVFENSVQILEAHPYKNLQSALSEVKSRIIQFLTKESLGDSISFSLVAIENSTLHTISLGNRTRVYLFSKGKVREVSSGLEQAPEDIFDVNSGYSKVTLTKGDKIILCTDGLFTMLQNQEELNIIGQYDQPGFGAKHLNSLAKGRNVEDSVTTGVINYGKSQSTKKLPLYILAGVILLAIVLFFSLPKQEVPLPEDLGVAIVTSGKVFKQNDSGDFSVPVDDFGAVNAGTLLIVNYEKPASFKLKTRTTTLDSTENISGITFFASESTVFDFINIDYMKPVDGKSSSVDLLDQTTVGLVNGEFILINESSPRGYHIQFTDSKSDKTIDFALSSSKLKSGIAATNDGATIQVYCFYGACMLSSGNRSVEIPANTRAKISIAEGVNNNIMPELISDLDIAEWDRITEGYFKTIFSGQN